MSQQRVVFCISDHTGLTAESFAHSLVSRFKDVQATYLTRPFIDTEEKLGEVLREIADALRAGPRPIVFSTLTDQATARTLKDSGALVLNLFDHFVRRLTEEIGFEPSRRVGVYHGMGDAATYQIRLDSLDFTLSTDDGLGTERYGQADAVIVGVSRVGKTPTCLYLSMQYGIRASNYPLTGEELEAHELPAALQPFRDRIYGLTIDPIRLYQIRQKRRPDSKYSSMGQCIVEVNAAERLFKRVGVLTTDTTARSIEEITATILHEGNIERRLG